MNETLSFQTIPANDNAAVIIDAPVCSACNAHGAARDGLCDDCDTDMALMLDEARALDGWGGWEWLEDPEAAAAHTGFNTDPRF
jgi:hypothetical protein